MLGGPLTIIHLIRKSKKHNFQTFFCFDTFCNPKVAQNCSKMPKIYFVFIEGGGGGGRKSGARKGQFAKSKGHHGRAGQNENAADNAGSILNMDPEYRTHMLFPGSRGREDDETLMGGRASGSPSFMKSVFGAGWGRRGTQGLPSGQPGLDPRFQITPEQLDPYLRGAKQVGIIKL